MTFRVSRSLGKMNVCRHRPHRRANEPSMPMKRGLSNHGHCSAAGFSWNSSAVTCSRRGYDVALLAYEVTKEHLTSELFRQSAAGHQELRDLKETAATLAKRVRADLQALARLHARASRRKWYGRKFVGGRIVGPAPRPWRRYRRAYARAVAILERDPCIQFLATTAFLLPGPGNPERRRNGALRSVGHRTPPRSSNRGAKSEEFLMSSAGGGNRTRVSS